MSFLWDILEVDALTDHINDRDSKRAVRNSLYNEAYDKNFSAKSRTSYDDDDDFTRGPLLTKSVFENNNNEFSHNDSYIEQILPNLNSSLELMNSPVNSKLNKSNFKLAKSNFKLAKAKFELAKAEVKSGHSKVSFEVSKANFKLAKSNFKASSDIFKFFESLRVLESFKLLTKLK